METRSLRSATRGDRPGCYKHRRTGIRRSVVEVELVLLRDRVPVLVPFLENGVEQGADDLAELLDFRAKSCEFPHHVIVGRRHPQPLDRAITGMVLIPLPSILGANSRNASARNFSRSTAPSAVPIPISSAWTPRTPSIASATAAIPEPIATAAAAASSIPSTSLAFSAIAPMFL